MSKKKSSSIQYDIGTWVLVRAKRVRNLDDFIELLKKLDSGPDIQKVNWIKVEYKKPVVGRIVGMCRRFSGTREHSTSRGGYWEPSEYYSYLKVEEEHIFYRVQLGWFNLPILVSKENMELLSLDRIPEDLPKLFTEQSEWNEQSRDDLRKCMVEVPRDKKGRWIKDNG